MPALVAWDNQQKTIIRQQLIGAWTFEDYATSARETQSLTASMPHTVHVIIDFTQSIDHPSKILAAGSALDRNMPTNQGVLVIVQIPPYIRAVFEVIAKMYPKVAVNSHEANSLEEAYAIIHKNEAASS